MNFKRIQSIFLLAFIVMDVFLLSMIIHNQSFQDNNINASSANSTLIKEMKRDQISVGKTPTEKGYGYYVSAVNDSSLKNGASKLQDQNVSYINNSIKSNFKEPINLNERKPYKTLDRIVSNSNLIVNGKNYQYDSKLSSKHQIIYNQKVLGSQFLSLDGRLTFDVSNGEVTGYTQTGLTDVKVLHERARTISGQRALIWLYQYNEIPNNTDVTSEDLGYTKMIDIKGNDVYIPTWVISMRNRSSNGVITKRINAFSGSVLKTEKFQQAPQVNNNPGPEAN